MAPARRQSNGRSPLVNPQRQITAFFSKTNSSSPSPSPSPSLSKLNPNPSPILKSNPTSKSKPSTNRSRSPSPSPTTPSPFQSRSKKPLLVIGQTPSPSSEKLYSEDIVGKRIRVYWPLDKAWYEGVVKSFDKESKKHLVLYDDAQEEWLEIGKEKIEWVEDSAKGFKRLRKVSSVNKKAVVNVEDMEMEDADDKKKSDNKEKIELEESASKFKRLRKGSAVIKKFVIDDDDEEIENGDDKDKSDNDNDSSDEDWGKNVNTLTIEDDDELLDLEDEENVEKNASQGVKKRKVSAGGLSLGSAKKSKSGGGVKISEPETKNAQYEKAPSIADNRLTGDAVERFSARDAEKFPFLGAERRDAKRRRPLDENYDPKTLYLPPDFLKSISGGQRQWWEFKSKHMDRVLFFKMGKFYELFEMDAHVGAKELDLQYMKGEQPHCGFPERNFSMHVEKLARKLDLI